MKLTKWRAKYPYALVAPSSWLELPNGENYCTLTEQYFGKWFNRLQGRRLLKIGGLSAEIRCQADCQQILLTPKSTEKITQLCLHQSMILIEDDRAELPFGDNSVDACLIAQNLNFSQDPHQFLRELQRILTDEGYLFISLFSPISPLLFKPKLKEWKYRHLCRWRVVDWLELLGFEILEQHNLPIKREFYWFASQSVIVAQKRTIPLSLQPQKVRFEMPEILNPAQVFKNVENS